MGLIKLAFSGKMRAGKDTACDYVVDSIHKSGFEVRQLAFADPIKAALATCQELVGFPQVRNREFFQMYGDWVRNQDVDAFVKTLERKVLDPEFDDMFTIVTDVRYPNEFDMLKQHGFLMVRISADEAVRLARGADKDRLFHSSEISLDAMVDVGGFDMVLNNNLSIEFFQEKLERLLIPTMWAWTKR